MASRLGEVVVDRARQRVDLGGLGDEAGLEVEAVDVVEGDGAVDVVAGEVVAQQLLDQAAGAGLEVAIEVGALGEHDGVHDAVRRRFGAGEEPVLQAGEVDLDGGAHRGRRRGRRVRRLVDQLLRVELQLDRRVGDRARAAADAHAVVDHALQVGGPGRAVGRAERHRRVGHHRPPVGGSARRGR